MIDDSVLHLMRAFPNSFINDSGEFIAHRQANEYFSLLCSDNAAYSESELLRCKVLEQFSRAAFKSEPFQTKKANDRLHAFMLRGINNFLGTRFSVEDMEVIYIKLGNGVDRTLSLKFVRGGYNFDILRGAK